MRGFLCLLFLALPLQVFSLCFPNHSFVSTASNSMATSENLIWIGELLGVDDQGAHRYRVLEVWCGNVNTGLHPDAPEYMSDYVNTENEIWLPLRSYRSTFVDPAPLYVLFSTVWGPSGYDTNYCATHFIPLDLNGELPAAITEEGVTYNTVEEIKTAIDQTVCEVANGLEKPIEVLDVFPNPTSDWINLPTTFETDGELTFSIFTIEGKMISLRKAITNEQGIDVSSLGNGLYFLRIETLGKTVGAATFLRQ